MSDKPPIVLIHGACSQPAHFEAWRTFFTDAGYDCVVPALPGHAPSDMVVLRRQGFADYLDAMRVAVTGLGRRPVVIGHSMGGLIARMLAAEGLCDGHRPRRAAAWWSDPGATRRHPLLCRASGHGCLPGQPFRPWRGAVRQLALHHLPPAEQDEIFAGFVAESGPRLSRPRLRQGEGETAGRSLSDARYVHGDADRLIPLATARGIADKHKAKLIVIRGHGHWLIAPSLVDRTAGRVLRWLERRGL